MSHPMTVGSLFSGIGGLDDAGFRAKGRCMVGARPLRYISMFSGIEAATVAFAPLRWTPLVFAEVDAFPSAVLNHHYPNVPNVGDMTRHDWAQYRGTCDLVVGGPPCQAFSVAGLRKSMDDDRGNLSLAYVKAIRAIDPLWSITENVPGWLSTPDNAFGCVLAGLVGADAALVSPLERGRWPDAGVVTGPERTAAWRILDAQYFGLAQRRRRVFVLSVRGARNWACAAALLPVGPGLSGHPAPRREAGQRVADSLTVGANQCLRRPGDFHEVTGPQGFRMQAFGDYEGDDTASTLKSRDYKDATDLIAHTLRADGFNASEDGTGRGTPLVPILEGGLGVQADHAYTLEARHLTTAMQVRRLTPRECERLQGFPDDYTLVTYRGKPAADGPRYKALGNSMAVPCMAWIGQRIAQVDALDIAPTGAA